MTRDNSERHAFGKPGANLTVSDVIKCRECGGLVRRVNTQHLQADRCMYTDPQKAMTADGKREDLLRPDHPETVQDYKEKYPDAPLVSPRERMKLAEANRDKDADRRRREILRRRWRGEDMSSIVESTAERYDVNERSVWRDWTRRDQWISRVFGLDDAESAIAEALAQKKDVVNRLNRVAQRAEDEQELQEARMALEAVGRELTSVMDKQMELSDVGDKATKQTIEVQGRVDHAHDHVHRDEEEGKPPGALLDQEQLAAIDEITGGENEEIIDAEYEVVENEEETDG